MLTQKPASGSDPKQDIHHFYLNQTFMTKFCQWTLYKPVQSVSCHIFLTQILGEP
jgi:hypothetical protein